ncbi:hypothetical protein AVEN_189602-1 [Araneus ventricosus]|uniref:Peptidase A2 domain-containing protein n=1 Tax=Araneus ventricosus TaxID=182803 RepID=A0A4Y2W6F4_ARAVE|nr:hypothetical protein AVEN_189602-1 [Araneus ventricosus]
MIFERYRIASGLSTKTGNAQVNSLLYIMGEQAEEIFSFFGLSETEQDDFDIVLKKFNDHFVVKKNTIFERAQFNKRVQLDGESVNTFITALYTLSEHCDYGVLHDELIRDRIVVGIRDKNLSEKLQLDADLTLTKVIERVRLSEVVKEQQGKLIEKDRCSEVAYLEVVQLESENKTNIDWAVTVQVNHKNIKFKIDSEADHTVLPANVLQNVFQNAKLEPPDKILCGPDRNPLKTHGKFKTNIEYKGKSCIEEIYVISNLQTCLLGKPALFSLGLGPNLNSICQISAADPKSKFPGLFKGLGVMKGCYSIKLKPGAIPFAIISPRRVPISLLK